MTNRVSWDRLIHYRRAAFCRIIQLSAGGVQTPFLKPIDTVLIVV